MKKIVFVLAALPLALAACDHTDRITYPANSVGGGGDNGPRDDGQKGQEATDTTSQT